MRKRRMKKVLALTLLLALVIGAMPQAEAAKKMKLSKNAVTMEKGKSKKITIKNCTGGGSKVSR